MTDAAKQENNYMLLRFLKLLHYALCIVIFVCGWISFKYHVGLSIRAILLYEYNIFAIILYALVLLFFYRTYNAYMLGYNSTKSLLLSQIISQIFTIVIIYGSSLVSWNRFDNPRALLYVFIAQVILDFVWTYIADGLYFKTNPPKKAILIYGDEKDKNRFGNLGGKTAERLYNICEELQFDGEFSELKNKLDGYEAIFVAGINSRCRNDILKYCKETGTPGLFLPHVGDVIMQEAKHIQTFDTPILWVNRKALNLEYTIVKRAFDIAASTIGLIILSPIFLIVAIAVIISDGGPVIFKQRRLTKDGKIFNIYKFRSIRTDAEDDDVTTVGRFIRRWHIDELPQLWNILIGDMSMVGPRPEQPELAELYYKELPDFKLRLQVKAGLTGYAQVYGKHDTDPYEKLEFDLMYINDMNVLTDLRLVFATFKILFSTERADRN